MRTPPAAGVSSCEAKQKLWRIKRELFQIIITSIPYRVNKADLIMKIADLVREKKLEGVKGLRDESTKICASSLISKKAAIRKKFSIILQAYPA